VMQERTVHAPDGQLLTDTFKDYLCPAAGDIPEPRTAHRETPSPLTPLGARGLGEGTTMSAPAALHNAVLDALQRDEPLRLPLSPPEVWQQIA